MLNAISKNHQQYYSKFMVKENKKENILEKENNQLHKSDVYTSAKVKTDTENMKIQKTETDTEKKLIQRKLKKNYFMD